VGREKEAAGPFARYGSKLVGACVRAGCGYADITGESDWVREMIEAHDDEARASGARIVHFAGHDCVPWDLSVLALAEGLAERGDTIARVDFYDEIRSAPSGGTIETAFGILFGGARATKKFAFDPLLRRRGAKAAAKTTARNVASVELAPPAAAPFGARSLFVMSGVNANAVKRSNALLDYSPALVYSEGLATTSLLAAVLSFSQLALFGLLVALPPARFLLRKFLLPKPGEGPSDDFMASGYLKVTGLATGARGTVLKSRMTFSVDPGYKDTARMVVEAALALALDKDKLAHVPGGVYTPAACQGKTLLDRLCKTGTAFEILDDATLPVSA